MNFRLILFTLLLGCTGSQEALPPPKRTLSISISHGTELRELFGELRSQFYRLAPPLPDGKVVSINLSTQPAAAVAKALYPSADQADAWIAPHELFIRYNNTFAKGTRYAECIPLFETSYGAVGYLEHISRFANADGTLPIEPLLDQAVPGGGKPNIRFPDPLDSATGWASLEYLAEIQNNRTPEDMPAIVSTLSRWQQYVDRYGVSEQALLGQITHTPNAPLITFATQQQFQRSVGKRKLSFYPLSPPSPNFTYRLCIREGLEKKKREALFQFETFLQTELARDSIARYEFNLPDSNLSSQSAFNPLPAHSAHDRAAERFFGLLMQWPEIQKPSGRILVLDASASLEGSPFLQVKEALKIQVAKSPRRTVHGIVSFDSSVHIHGSPTSDRMKVLATLDSLNPSGGSAVYDGILSGFYLLDEIPKSAARRSIYVITDGDDRNSNASLLDVLAAASRYTHKDQFNFFLIGLRTSSDTSFDALEQIAKAVHGTFVEIYPNQAAATLNELLKASD